MKKFFAIVLVVVLVFAMASVAFAAGMEVGWNPTDRKAVAAGAAGSVKIGHAVALTGASDAAVFVRLCQGLS